VHQLGYVDLSFLVFEAMNREDVAPNTLTFNSLIDSYIHFKDFENAVGTMMEDMAKRQIVPEPSTYATLLLGLVEHSQDGYLRQVLKAMHNNEKVKQLAHEVEELLAAKNNEALLQKLEGVIHAFLDQEMAAADAAIKEHQKKLQVLNV